MLDVMPKLDHQSDGPPFMRGPSKTSPECPETNKHHDGITVVHELRTHEPGKKQTKNPSRLRARPAQYINLIGLAQMFGPMGQHNQHEQIKCASVPNAIQLLINTKVGD